MKLAIIALTVIGFALIGWASFGSWFGLWKGHYDQYSQAAVFLLGLLLVLIAAVSALIRVVFL